MNIDTGLVVVIVAVLVFYLRLILLQRERAKRLAQAPPPTKKQTKKQKAPAQVDFKQRYSILSNRRSDLVIAGLGILSILAGILLYMAVLPLSSIQPYWWLPTAAGIVAFSWAFRL
jgi:hypothetical protein